MTVVCHWQGWFQEAGVFHSGLLCPAARRLPNRIIVQRGLRSFRIVDDWDMERRQKLLDIIIIYIYFFFMSQISSVPFLDTRITVTPTGQYSTELYFKPMASPIIIHFTSAQPIQVKLAVLNSELTRAKRTGSNDEAIERGIQKVTNIFLSNGS